MGGVGLLSKPKVIYGQAQLMKEMHFALNHDAEVFLAMLPICRLEVSDWIFCDIYITAYVLIESVK